MCNENRSGFKQNILKYANCSSNHQGISYIIKKHHKDEASCRQSGASNNAEIITEAEFGKLQLGEVPYDFVKDKNADYKKEMRYEIYKYLPDEIIQSFPLVEIKKDTVFIPIDKQEKIKVYYILEGRADCFSLSRGGREYLVDSLGSNEFVGKFSQARQADFRCGVRAGKDLKLLDLTSWFSGLLEEFREFRDFFEHKTSGRVYEIYRISLLRMQFGYEEIFAYCLLISRNKTTNFVSDVDIIFSKMNISERQGFYLLKKFKDRKLIMKVKKQIKILDEIALEELAENVFEFMEG